MRDETRCVTRVAVDLNGYDSLTVPVHRASTIRYPDARSFLNRFERGADGYVYGLYGTPTHRFLEKKITELEGGVRTVLAQSGQAAITCTMLALLRAGDRILLPDTVYGPVRDFANNELHALGVVVVFYDPLGLDDLARQIDAKTKLVWVESPGSVTMELQDVAAIAALAHEKGALVGCDNTWASPLNFKPLAHGADLVVEALSKHFCGHSDVLMGSVTVRDEELGLRLKSAFGRIGMGTSPDDCALISRGIETLAVRLRHASGSGMEIARWLQDHPLVDSVLHPALPAFSGHALWQRDFAGSAGVFSFCLKSSAVAHAAEALDALELISIGASWGGTKSLLAPVAIKALRTVRPWSGSEFILRLSVGMEATVDLIADLTRFFEAINARISKQLETSELQTAS